MQQVWGKPLSGDAIHTMALGFFNLDSAITTASISFFMPLRDKPHDVYCVDVWSSNPEENACPYIPSPQNSGKGIANNEDWDIQLLKQAKTGAWWFKISALNVTPTSSRLLRLSFRYPMVPEEFG